MLHALCRSGGTAGQGRCAQGAACRRCVSRSSRQATRSASPSTCRKASSSSSSTHPWKIFEFFWESVPGLGLWHVLGFDSAVTFGDTAPSHS
jgi:hypothetical protein